MKIFISWSGEASRECADTLHQYLPLMPLNIEPFMSKHDIGAGTRWEVELASELEKSDFGILCLTPQNLESPWILFEAGALTKHMTGRACSLLFGGLTPTSVKPPLTQFFKITSSTKMGFESY